jgi:CheY-like chemotaxis protein
VEDDPEYAKAIRMLLEGNGYSVLEANDGNRAWHVIEQEKPDVTLLD